MKLLILSAALFIFCASLRVAAEPTPEYIIRDPVESFDNGYRANVYLRWLQKDYQIVDHPIRLPSNTAVIGVRIKVILPYQSLFLYLPNNTERDLKWWVDFRSESAPQPVVDQLRAEIRQTYQERTNETPATDFTMRQMDSQPFHFKVESLALDANARGLSKVRSIARKSIERDALVPANEIYRGLHNEFGDEPLITSSFHFDRLTPPQKGTLRDLSVSQMWIDKRGNYVAVLSSTDSITAAHYTGRHPFYFGNLEKPEMYQFYSKSEHSSHSKCQYNVLRLEVFASTPAEPGRTISVHLENDGALYVSTSDESTCLKEASAHQRLLLMDRLQSGNAILRNMPETREIVSVYKMDDSNTYIYIDALARSHIAESYQMFIGPPGKLQSVDILQIHQIESAAGGAIIYTPLGKLHATTNFGSLSRPYWETADGKTFLRPVVTKPRTEIVPFLQQLGVDVNRLREKTYQSPCEFLLRKSPMLKLVI